jgi:hypothetical protein
MAETGTLVVYNAKPVTCNSAQEIEDLGNGLWKIYFPENMEGSMVKSI